MKQITVRYLDNPITPDPDHVTWSATAATNGFDQAVVIATGNPFAIFANLKLAILTQWPELSAEAYAIDTTELETTDWSRFDFGRFESFTFHIDYGCGQIKITMRRCLFVGLAKPFQP